MLQMVTRIACGTWNRYCGRFCVHSPETKRSDLSLTADSTRNGEDR